VGVALGVAVGAAEAAPVLVALGVAAGDVHPLRSTAVATRSAPPPVRLVTNLLFRVIFTGTD
jgi:hypothetical protein